MWEAYLRDVLEASYCRHSRNKSKLLSFFFYWYVYDFAILLLLIDEFIFIVQWCKAHWFHHSERGPNECSWSWHVCCPPLVVAAPHDAAFASCAAYFTFKHTMKRPTKKFFGKHPFLNILTNKFYYMDFYEFSMNLNWHSIFSIFSQPSLFILHIFSKAYRLIWEEKRK